MILILFLCKWDDDDDDGDDILWDSREDSIV